MDHETIRVQLIPISEIRLDDKNPRKRHADRFEAIKQSLSIFGWLMPAYVTQDFKVVSGHQRITAWGELGNDQVPVIITRQTDMAENILFNLSTNDVASRQNLAFDSFKELTPPDFLCADKYPCLKMAWLDESELPFQEKIDGHQFFEPLVKSGVFIPIVVGSDGRIANGKNRIYKYRELGFKKVPVVYSEHHSNQIGDYLNLISMEFDVKTHMNDALMYGSFSRPRNPRCFLGHGFSAWINFKQYSTCADFDHTLPSNQKKLRSRFGKIVVDFGAGDMTETQMLKDAGLEVYSFEPYHVPLGTGFPDLQKSIEICTNFLEAVGKPIDSFIISSVFNSVPYLQYRRYILAIAAAMNPKKLYLKTLHDSHLDNQHAWGKSKRDEAIKKIRLAYEPDVMLGEITGTPKVQKYYSLQGIKDLVSEFFEETKGFNQTNNVFVVASKPKKIDPEFLREALAHEFNLPYLNGTSLNLQQHAFRKFNHLIGPGEDISN